MFLKGFCELLGPRIERVAFFPNTCLAEACLFESVIKLEIYTVAQPAPGVARCTMSCLFCSFYVIITAMALATFDFDVYFIPTDITQ